MTNAEVIQTMTVKELARFLAVSDDIDIPEEWEHWLRSDSQSDGGLLTEGTQKYWRAH